MLLITGGKGFIGRSITSLLLKEDFILLDPECDEKKRGEFRGVTNSESKLEDIFSTYNISTVIHLGMSSTSHDVKESPEIGRASILDGTKNLLYAMRKFSSKRIVFISSSMVYGNFQSIEASEEDHCKPIDLYGQLKLEAEMTVKEYCSTHGIDFIIVRPTAVYGIGDKKERVVEKFISNARQNKPIKIKGSKTQLDFTYVDDVSKAILKLAKSENIKNETFNISRGEARSLLELSNIISNYFPNTHIKIENQDINQPKRGKLSIAKAKKIFDYNPQISLEEGIDRVVRRIR